MYFLDENEKNNVIKLTKELIRIPSSWWDDNTIYNFTYDYLKMENLNPIKGNTKKFSLNPDISFFNVYVKLGNKKGPKIHVNGHLDTVNSKSDWFYPQYSAHEEEGKIYGLGSADMKAGCAAAIQSVASLLRRKKEINGELFLSLVYGEEAPFSLGSDQLINEYNFKNYDLNIITEPSPALTIDNYCFVHDKFYKNPKFPVYILGAEGRVLFEVEFFGQTSHASHPKRGINSLHDSAEFIHELINFNRFSDIKKGRGEYLVLNIDGGDESFTVPGYCRLLINRQLGIGEKINDVEKEIKKIIKNIKPKSTVRVKKRTSPSKDVEYNPYLFKSSEYIEKFINANNSDNQKECRFISSSVGDFNLFATRTKVPTIVFGPGGGRIHSANEYVNKEEIIQTTEHLLNFFIKVF